MTSTHFLQSESWEEFQKALGNKTVRINNKLGIFESGRGGNRLYFPYLEEFTQADLEQIEKDFSKKRLHFIRCDFLSDESAQRAKTLGFKKAVSDAQPSITAVADVKNKDDFLKRVSKSQRKMYRHNLAASVTFEFSSNPADIEIFFHHINSVAERTGMVPREDNYYRVLAKTLFEKGCAGLIIAKKDGKAIASKIVIFNSSTLYILHSGSFSEFRELNVNAALNVWILEFANQKGLEFVDFYGVAPEEGEIKTKKDRKKYASWQGFTRFKLSFGAERKKYGGTYELPLNKLHYFCYRFLRKLLG